MERELGCVVFVLFFWDLFLGGEVFVLVLLVNVCDCLVVGYRSILLNFFFVFFLVFIVVGDDDCGDEG